MSKLNIDQNTIMELFANKRSDFLIPDYQRPYAWGEEECFTLWEDIFQFAFPENDRDKFDKEDEYYLGPIVTFKNEDGKKEVIDGQQRLTTLMLLLRAFYDKFRSAEDQDSIKTRESIEKCIWKTDEFGNPLKNELKINSEVATDDSKEEFLQILNTGVVEKGQNSKYAQNYKFFQIKIEEFLGGFPMYFSYFPNRILNNCILLPIEADDQNTALRIFSTLNDRGLPLSDADIFKAQFYKFYKNMGKKDYFISEWKMLEEISTKMFNNSSNNPMGELFTRYMYFERAKLGIKSSTTEALRKFYEKDTYILLKKEETFKNLIDLAEFWKNIESQNDEIFSLRVLKQLYILNFAPNSMWTYFVSVYFMEKKNSENHLKDEEFYKFLRKITAFIWVYALFNPGVNQLRTPIYAEMVNLVNGKEVQFESFKFDYNQIERLFNDFDFLNRRPITKSMLAWWLYQDEEQELISFDRPFEVEHIFAKNRQEHEKSLKDVKNLESLGNKSFLEKKINIRASDYRFLDKKKYYKGYTTAQGIEKEETVVLELKKMASNKVDFSENDIEERKKMMLDLFFNFIKENDLFL